MAKKIVQFALDTSLSFGSPSFGGDESTSSDANNNTATLQYVNSQLISHGYTYQPGISLEGISKDEGEKVVKCFLAMLGQRVDDMSRTEDLATKMRTLSYDHDRLMGMYRTATEKAANAEKEMNVHKSRLASTTRSLASATSAHKATTAELQRTRTALQSVRATHQTEIKKLEKEKEKLLEKVSKLSEYQYTTKISGVRYANAGILSESMRQTQMKADAAQRGFLEVSLEESENSRKRLIEENARLQGLITRMANDLQNVGYEARCAAVDLGLLKDEAAPVTLEEPSLITALSLFPLEQPDAASDKVTCLVSELKHAVSQLCNPDIRIGGVVATALRSSRSSTAQVTTPDATLQEEPAEYRREVQKLQHVIETLQQDLEEAQSQASAYASQAKDLLEQFSNIQESLKAAHKREIERRTYAEAEELDNRAAELETQAKELEDNQSKFADAALKLSKDRVAFESEKLKFLEEKRSWQVSAMLGDAPSDAAHPPQPIASSSKQRLDEMPSTAASSSKRKFSSVEDADDVLDHLPPPSPQVDSVLDEDREMDVGPPAPVPEPRRSPRKATQKTTNTLKRTRQASASPLPSGGPVKKARVAHTRRVSGSGVTAKAGSTSATTTAAKKAVKTKGKEPEKAVKRPAAAKGKERAKPKAVPSFSTEVIPRSPLPTTAAAPSLPAFVLPPPSPAARIPQLHIPSTSGAVDSPMKDPDNPFDLDNMQPTASSEPSQPAKQPQPPVPSSSTAPPPIPSNPLPVPSAPLVPQTPSRRIFPNGKPRAPHMVHAYSPVKPSPLSRILMLANSPDSPEDKLDPLAEMDEADEEMPPSPTPARPNARRMSLAEVGLESEEEEMDDEEEVESLIRNKGKGKACAEPSPRPPAKTRAAAAAQTRTKPVEPLRIQKEKENVRRSPRTRAKARVKPAPEGTVQRVATRSKVIDGGVKKVRSTAAANKVTRPGSSTRVTTRSSASTTPGLQLADLEKKGGPVAKTRGPRRVPIDSADAAPIIPAWKG